jgi:hypothetical protein
MSGAVSISVPSLRVKIAAVCVALVLLISTVFLLNMPSIERFQSAPFGWKDVTTEKHAVLYHIVISDDNITVGEMSFTWEVRFSNESLEEYDYYEFYFHESVSGAHGEGRILGGTSVLNLTTTDQMLRTWNEYHGAGAVELTVSSNTSWGGDFQWRFAVAPDSGIFQPQLATNKLDFELSMRTTPGADVNLTLVLVSEWLVHSQGPRKIIWTETLSIAVNRTAYFL